MRRTDYQRKYDATCDKIEAELQAAVQAELNWLFRQIQFKIRRINRFKPSYVGPHQPLQKTYYTNIDLWDKFRKKMHVSILRALLKGFISLTALSVLRYINLAPINFDSDEYARAVAPELGQRITYVSKTIKKLVGKKIVAWYNTPGMTMQALIDDLSQSFNFGAYRANLIAQTELTYLVSAISDLEAQQTGSEKWFWNSKNDQTVCTHEFIGPDGKKYKGCRELHGKIFNQGLPKPPKSSHIGCRCNPINIAGPYREPKIEAQSPIVDLPFGKAEWNEQEHPRVPAGHEGGGEFTSKDKPTITPLVLTNDQKIAAALHHNVNIERSSMSSASRATRNLQNQFIPKDTYELANSLSKYLGISSQKYDYDTASSQQNKMNVFSDYTSSNDARKNVKDKICKILANKSGMTYFSVDDFIRNWARTSNGSDDAIIAQKAASEIFDVELSQHQKQKSDSLFNVVDYSSKELKDEWKEKYAEFGRKYMETTNSLYDNWRKKNQLDDNIDSRTTFLGSQEFFEQVEIKMKFPDSAYMVQTIKEHPVHALRSDFLDHGTRYNNLISEYVDNYKKSVVQNTLNGKLEDSKKILSAMYEHTQKVLAEQGYKPDDEITLFRGFTGSKDNRVPDDSLMKEVTVHGNAMESWSMDVHTAMSFGDTVLATKVKIKDIVGTCATGYGCLNEKEIVVKGGLEYPATVIVCPGGFYGEQTVQSVMDAKIRDKVQNKFGMMPEAIPYLDTATQEEKEWILNEADEKQFMNWVDSNSLGPDYKDVNTGHLTLIEAQVAKKIKEQYSNRSKWELAVYAKNMTPEEKDFVLNSQSGVEIHQALTDFMNSKPGLTDRTAIRREALVDKLNSLYNFPLGYKERYISYIKSEAPKEEVEWLVDDSTEDSKIKSWIKSMASQFKHEKDS